MRYEIPCGEEILFVNIPEENVIFYVTPVQIGQTLNADELIEEALDAPFGSLHLEEAVASAQKILVLLDDITRPTPKKQLIEHIIVRLERAGKTDNQIMLAFAPGTHRPLTEEEILKLLGAEIVGRFEIININYKNTERLVYIGDSPSGIPIDVYREAVEADYLIGIGNIVPHVSAGWGGGAKIVQPGICGERTTQGTHLMAALEQNVMETCGNADNKCRHEMELIAKRVGLKFIVNTVMDEHQRLQGVFCGDCVEAHRAGVAMAKKVLCPEIPAKADILIASANPCEIDFWQGGKPYVFAQYAIRDGGTLIFVMEGREGLCGNSPEHEYVLRHYSTLSEETIRLDVQNGVISDLIGVDTPIYHDQIRKRGINVLLVTKGFTQADADALGFELARDLDTAIEKAFRIQGSLAKVGIIPYCGETLVRCINEK